MKSKDQFRKTEDSYSMLFKIVLKERKYNRLENYDKRKKEPEFFYTI
jgi:hypothetical protein